MHNNNTNELQYKELLKINVEQKFGVTVKYSKDCRILSEQVFQATGRQLSVSTIKRFFGLISTPFYPSKYTLDTFSAYLGMENWEAFVGDVMKDNPEISDSDQGRYLKESFQSITQTSYLSISRRIRYNPDTFVYRKFAEAFFEDFMSSGRTATMLISPSGYGKTAILLQWMKSFFSGKDLRFREDVVCLIDGNIFFSFYNQIKERELLWQLLDFDFKVIQDLFLKQKTNPVKVRYFLLIDDVDRIFCAREKYNLFTENLMRVIMLNKDNPWFKVVLTCRPENLDTFTSLMRENPLLGESFYQVNFMKKNQPDITNVPLFNDDEIKTAFSSYKRNRWYYFLSLYYPDVLKIIKTPLYFSFFINEVNPSPSDFSEIGFLNSLIQHFFYTQPFAEEKQQLVSKYLQLCRNNNNYLFVRKELLLNDNEYKLPYQELVKSGLIYEYMDAGNRPEVQLNVRFLNNEVFEYLAAWALIRETGLTARLINTVFDAFSNNIPFQYSLLKWLVKIAFFEGNTSFLKQLHQMVESQVDVAKGQDSMLIPGALRSIQYAFMECFRKNRRLNEVLLSVFAESELGQRLYLEESLDMDNLMNIPDISLSMYNQNNSTAEGKMIFHFIHFIRGYYLLNHEACNSEFKSISRINYMELNSPLSLGYYFASWFIYACLNNYQKRDEMLKKFLKTSDKLRKKGKQTSRNNPGFEYMVVYYLDSCNFFVESRFVSKYIDGLQDSAQNHDSGFYQYFRLCCARALLHTGEQEQAMEMFRKINFHGFPFHMKHFMQMNVNVAMVDFLHAQNQITEALTLMHETRLMAQQMGYNYFVQKADELEFKLLKANSGSSS